MSLTVQSLELVLMSHKILFYSTGSDASRPDYSRWHHESHDFNIGY